LIRALSAAYGAAAAWRRRWYDADPSRRRRLTRPVISVGNLGVGGSGKTPAVEYVVRLLRDAGERPAILIRGYARRVSPPGVTVVSDGERVCATLPLAGDEALMLAAALPGVPVLVGADRYLSGRLAERQFGVTVHVLDDGFQHLPLARDVDLLLVSEDDLADRPLPAGRLRERLDAARHADAALVTAGYDTAAERVARSLGIETAFRVTRTITAPHTLASPPEPVVVPPGARVFVVTGIAKPDRFLADVAAAGWEIAGSMTFRDHYPFGDADVRRIAAAAKHAASAIVLTTEKDAVRLAACDLSDLPIASVPLAIAIEPAVAFREWLLARVTSSPQSPATSPQSPATSHQSPATSHQSAPSPQR
jgi:tetraacyldisaccharide 4'-kinase